MPSSYPSCRANDRIKLAQEKVRRASTAATISAHGAPQRLQKILAAAGLGSRRQCEELITTGRVQVDRRVVTELGTRADAAKQEIRVDGQMLPRPRLHYYAVHKPPGVLSTNRDPSGRRRVIDLLPQSHLRYLPSAD